MINLQCADLANMSTIFRFSNMTPDQAIDYIKRNRQFLNLSGIAKDAGIHPTQLIGYINGKPRKSGYMPPMSNEKLWDLAKVVKKLKEG